MWRAQSLSIIQKARCLARDKNTDPKGTGRARGRDDIKEPAEGPQMLQQELLEVHHIP